MCKGSRMSGAVRHKITLLVLLLGSDSVLAQGVSKTDQGEQHRSIPRGPILIALRASTSASPQLAETAEQSRHAISYNPPPNGNHPHRALRFTLIGAALGGVVGAIWVGEAATTGTSEASMSKHDAHVVGAVIGVVVGATTGALIHL